MYEISETTRVNSILSFSHCWDETHGFACGRLYTELQPQSLAGLVKEYKHTGAGLRN